MTQIPQGSPDLNCPFHHKQMSKVCSKCPLWVQIRGKNPQTGLDVDDWQCSFAVLPMLLIENAKQTRSTTIATESFRNEMVKAQTGGAEALAALIGGTAPKQQLLEEK